MLPLLQSLTGRYAKESDEGDFQRITRHDADRNHCEPDQSSGTQPLLTSQEVEEVFFNRAAQITGEGLMTRQDR